MMIATCEELIGASITFQFEEWCSLLLVEGPRSGDAFWIKHCEDIDCNVCDTGDVKIVARIERIVSVEDDTK